MVASSRHYGSVTLVRPLKANVRVPSKPGWYLSLCPYCGAECWKLPVEPVITPNDTAFACTNCAFKRSQMQRVMDAERAAREANSNLKIDDLIVIGSSVHWRIVVFRNGNRWVGGALGNVKEGRFLNVFPQISENHELGITDFNLAVKQTSAVADDPEQGFGPVEDWFIDGDKRGTLADFPRNPEDPYFCEE